MTSTMAATTSMSSTESIHIFNITPEQRKALLSSQENHQQLDPSLICSLKEIYEKEGFVLVRGLLEEQLIDRICNAGQALTGAPAAAAHLKVFNSLEFGPVFNVDEEAFRDVSLNSAIPALIAKVLMDEEDEAAPTTTLRVLKDAFFAKGKEEKHCGWHVDDSVFWPTESSSSGVNVWLALDDIPSKYGGGMAISPGSHVAEWRTRAYETIGSTPTLTPAGASGSTLLNNIRKTCAMESLNDEMYERFESSKLELDYQPGDCLFCNRWLFHRSVPINQEGLKHYKDEPALKRYTIRYERGTARLLKGVSLEPSVLNNPGNSGRSLDDVCGYDGPYYPQCWPPLEADVNEEQKSRMEVLAKENLPAAQVKKGQLMKDLMAASTKKEVSYS